MRQSNRGEKGSEKTYKGFSGCAISILVSVSRLHAHLDARSWRDINLSIHERSAILLTIQ